MKTYLHTFLLILLTAILSSCHTLNSTQTTVIKKFAASAKGISDLPYRIMYDYYSIEFKRKQLMPEIYLPKDSTIQKIDSLPQKVMSELDEIKNEYEEDLKTAGTIKLTYDLLETYIMSLEKLSQETYTKDFEKKSAEIGAKMNGLVTSFNQSPGEKIHLSMNPGEWLSSLATMYGRIKLKTKQASLLKEYITKADELVQNINRNYQDIQVEIMRRWYKGEKEKIRDQFQRSIGPYLRNLYKHSDSAAAIASIEFYSRVNPVYYELIDEVKKGELLIEQTKEAMTALAQTHSSMKDMFASSNNFTGVTEEVNGLKEKLFVIKDLFNKEGQEKFNFYKNFLMQNEKSFKTTVNQ